MAWYNETGSMQDVVISTRVRLARNLEKYPFASRLDDKSADEIIEKVSAALPEYGCEKFTEANDRKCLSYMEMHYVSPEFAGAKKHRALLSGENERVKIMLCEEDHLRLQCILAGFEPQKAYEYAARADDTIGKSVDIAFSEKYGYLTHCPTNLGAAMRVSAMLCLPALSKTRAFEEYVNAAAKMGITVRGIYGEGSRAAGELYQISNRGSLGISESDIIKLITDAVGKLVDAERKARVAQYKANPDKLKDRCARCIGILKNAHMLTSGEVSEAFATLKLGVTLGIIGNTRDERLTELLIAAQPATVSMIKQGLDGEAARDAARASLVRDMLREVTVNYGV